jgi:aerobic carbon-monoxide dehydrogenase medium subunit
LLSTRENLICCLLEVAQRNMIPQSFEYLRPETLSEAIALLDKHGENAKILSGGQSLIPMMKMRLARPEYIVDINRLPDLHYIKEEDGFLKIGGLTREADLEASELVRSKYPIILDTARLIADPQVRSLATVGGNLAHGDPANDHPATMLALGAEIIAAGKSGERNIPIKDFFLSVFTTALEPGEIVTEVRIKIPPAGSGGAYFKLERKVGDFATAGVAAQVTLDSGGICRRAGIGLTNVGPIPIKAIRAEESLASRALDDAQIRQAAELAAGESQPSSDLRGPAEYKQAMVRELTRRALSRARERARR